MAKDAFYFPHDFHSRSDPKTLKLLKDGWENYGIYWAIIEMLHEQSGYLPLDFETIAYELRTNYERIKYVVESYDLFLIKNGRFTSQRVLDNIEHRKEKSLKATQSIQKRWLKNTNVLRTNYEGNTIKERKGKEKKEIKENKEEETLFMPFDSEEFSKMWENWKGYKKDQFKFEYKTKISEQAALKELSEISNSNEQIAMKIILQSISKGWKGLFELKTNLNGTGQQTETAADRIIKTNADYFANL